ncbi:MAG: hypothetical protein HYZ72_07515, partial [Deltaproteobacteria bacterium]|nr:hypothetical protein [Deltaproteobacteria bacterium]
MVILKATVNDPDSDKVKLQIEMRRLDEFGGAFTGQPTQESTLVTSGSQAQVIAFGLINGDYHWRARTIDAIGATSEWVSFGGNPDSATDFIVTRPQSAADLAVIGVDVPTPSALSQETIIKVKVKNKGSQPLPPASYIVLLNHLFLRPVPTELGGVKTERTQKGREAAFDLRKGFIHRKLLAQ